MPEVAEKYGHNQRPSGKAQLDGLRHARNVYRKASEQDSQSNAEEDRSYPRGIKLLLRVSQQRRHLLHILLDSDCNQNVSYKDYRVGSRHDFNTGSQKPGYAYSIISPYGQALHGPSVHAVLCDIYPLDYKMFVKHAPFLLPHALDLLAERRDGFLEVVPRDNCPYTVPCLKHGSGGWNLHCHILAADSGKHEVETAAVVEIQHGLSVRQASAHNLQGKHPWLGNLRRVSGIQFLRFRLHTYPEDHLQNQYGEDDTHNSQRIGNRITKTQILHQTGSRRSGRS